MVGVTASYKLVTDMITNVKGEIKIENIDTYWSDVLPLNIFVQFCTINSADTDVHYLTW